MSAISSMKKKRGGHSAVSIDDDQILIVGGYYGGDFLKSTEIINIVNINNNNDNDDTIPQLPTERSGHASVGIGNFAFVIGGVDGPISTTNTVLRINTNNIHNPTTKWESVTPMQQGRKNFAAIAIGDVIYAVGGSDENDNELRSIEILNTSTTTPKWVTLTARMPTPRESHCAVAIGNDIYIIGGYDDNRNILTSVQMFDTASQTITEGPALPIPIWGMSAVAIGSLVVVVGGVTTGGLIGHFYVLDTSASNPEWRRIGVELQTKRSDHTAVVVGDKVSMCGGYDGDNYLDSIETISIVDLLPHDLLNKVGLSLPFATRNTNTGGFNDTPNNSTPDRLGYATYAKGLVKVAQQAEGPNTSFCVGLNAPWGAGKSFLYKLIKGELQYDEILQERKLKQREEERKKNNDNNESESTFMKEFEESYDACNTYIGKNILSSNPVFDTIYSWKDSKCELMKISIRRICAALIALLHLFWVQKQKFSFLKNKDIQKKFLNTLEALWIFVYTSPFQDNMIQNIFSFVVLLIPLGALILIVFLFVVAAISCFIILPWLAWQLLVLLVVGLFSEAASKSGTKIIKLVRIGQACDYFENERNNNKKEKEKEQMNEAVRTVAVLILASLVWICPWIILFALSFLDYVVKNTIVKAISFCVTKKNPHAQGYTPTPAQENGDNNGDSTNNVSSPLPQPTTPADQNNIPQEPQRQSEEQEHDEEQGNASSSSTNTQTNQDNNLQETQQRGKEENAIESRVRNILTGAEEMDSVDLASPGLSRFVVKQYLSTVQYFRYGSIKDDIKDEYEEIEQKKTKYICVEFNPWTYNGSDHLWKSILLEIWEAVGNVYGKDNLGQYRSGVELIRSQNGRGSTDAIDAKSLYQQRQDALQSLNTKTSISVLIASLTGILTAINCIKPAPENSSPILKALYNNVLLYVTVAFLALSLVLLVKYIYVYIRYVLPTVQINDKASSKRDKYLGDTGLEGFVKEEFEYILDFLRYAPLPEKYRKRYDDVRLSVLIDDLDRCNKDTVMKILQAVILLLNDAPVTCWLALDTGIVVSSIEQEMKDQLEEAGMTGYDFIEKIIQLPLCIPDLDTNQKVKFISRLFVQDKLDSLHLVNLIGDLVKKHPRLALDGSSIFLAENHSFGTEEEEEHALRVLVYRMKDVMKKKLSGESLFDSRLAVDPNETIQTMENAIVEKEWQTMEKADKEDFLFLVCEWIEWFQQDSRKQEPQSSSSTNEYKTESDKESQIVDQDNNDNSENNANSQARQDGEPQPSANNPNQDVAPILNDEENPKNVVEVRPVLETMVSIEEKAWFSQYARYMTGKARVMTRIMNIYNLARYLVDKNLQLDPTDLFRKKLLKVIVLCEQWPYRMSWLLQIAEDVMQESVLKDKEEKADKRANKVFKQFAYMGLKVVKKGIANGNKEQEEDDKNRSMDSNNSGRSRRGLFSSIHTAKTTIAEDNAELEMPAKIRRGNSHIGGGESLPTKVYEREVLNQMKNLSLFDTYHFIVESLLYSSDNIKKDLSRDGDPQIFKQLLSEDAEDDCDLKLIDIALPNYFVKDPSLNYQYRSLRPYMVNMYRHTIEKTAKYMERCVIHDNVGMLAAVADNKSSDNGDEVTTGPRLLIEEAESYYKKN